MSYIPNTLEERQEMLESMGLKSMDELFVDIPASMRAKELNIEAAKSEIEVRRIVEGLASENKIYKSCFRGAGSYDHYIPAIVKTVTSKEEFVTAYTPYQAEISQGVLQNIFEYQTMMCELTGMDVSNASVYDGAVACAEAVFMCQERKRATAIISGTVNPQVQEVVKTYCASRNVPVIVVPAKDGLTDLEGIKANLTKETACVIMQQPNFFGNLEDADSFCAAVHEVGAKAIMSVNPISLGAIKTPGECGADIAVAEGQPLGMPMAWGGPYLGIMTATSAMMRKLPGRIVGETVDHDGRRAFVLTLQAREQHIRREKASSNICSNEALCAMTAAVYLAAVGPEGLKNCANQCMAKAHYAASELCKINGISMAYDTPFFHEFVTKTDASEKIIKALDTQNILGGLPIEGGILWCVTEKQSKQDIDEMVAIVKEVCA
ncbi:MAG: aminomethyl-transferring glycine dehydrogenase subunit GcvPA [Phascolarctobacterium sp.]|nr:aminomethyl-transferring glycine dehydrogenase subunit GcvPA [Phascolarctobacterium sp.]